MHGQLLTGKHEAVVAISFKEDVRFSQRYFTTYFAPFNLVILAPKNQRWVFNTVFLLISSLQ